MRLAPRIALVLVLATALVGVGLGAPERAPAAPCFLLFTCPDPTPVTPPPAATPSPLPPPPTPNPVPGPPVPPPPGNPECKPRPLGGAGAARRGVFVGVGDAPVASDPQSRRCSLATMSANGVRIVRAVFAWFAAESVRGKLDLGFYDEYVGGLARYRIRVLPVLYGSPPFYSAAPGARYPERVQPRGNRRFAGFARTVARRYGPRGSFWRSNPGLPRVPIRSWQVWNEPNLRFFWAPRPNPRQYVRLLAATGRAIKSVDRRAEIITGGVSDSQFGTPVERYVRGIYRAGGARFFDTLALHPYARTASASIRAVERIRRLMNRHGDRRGRIWVTEYGWASGGPRHRFRAGERRQAKHIRKLVRTLWRRRARLRVRGTVQVMWGDLPLTRSDYWGLHVGLYKLNGKPKRAARTFRDTARGLR